MPARALLEIVAIVILLGLAAAAFYAARLAARRDERSRRSASVLGACLAVGAAVVLALFTLAH